MKHKNTIVRRLPLIFIIAGVCFVGVGFGLVNFDITKLDSSEKEVFIEKEKTISLHEISKIDISSFRSTITITHSSNDQLHIRYKDNKNYPIQISSSSQNLRIYRKSPSFSFKPFQFTSNDSIQVPITIELPQSYQEDIEIENSYGSISLQDQTLKNLTLQNERDEINVANILCDNLSMDISYGKAILQSIQSTRNIELSAERSELNTNTLQASSFSIESSYTDIVLDETNIQHDVQIEAERGSIKTGSINTQKLQLNSSYSNIYGDTWVVDDQINITSERGKIIPTYITTQTLRLDTSYSDVKGDTWTIQNLMDIMNERSDYTMKHGNFKDVKIISSYGDIHLGNATLNTLDFDMERGSIDSEIIGSINDYSIQTDIEHGENSLPTNFNKGAPNKVKGSIEYGDNKITFQQK